MALNGLFSADVASYGALGAGICNFV